MLSDQNIEDGFIRATVSNEQKMTHWYEEAMTDYPINSEAWKRLVGEGAEFFDLHLTREHTENFGLHALELMKWNRRINLTAITEPSEIALKHFADSLAPASLISPGSKLLDIGSGGGFPGIPLKVMIPSLSVTLIDASRKKVSFQKHVIRMLKLGNIEAVHARAEELAKNRNFIRAFDVIICRALSALDEFAEMALPLLAENGLIIALKGRISHAELDAMRAMLAGSQIALSVRQYKLPRLGAERSIVSGIEKTSEVLETSEV
ncbi:MAG: 16S rRNA (guanine(527)-N(7))-methyltransferase RsmG [Desulfobacteraceae bacterium 4572_88]|nr:MAG: 16S rRNA (guanine(527)-N(7))-methyltransferase RsmG [Desulfobacteraceae bacterium 4572_88]